MVVRREGRRVISCMLEKYKICIYLSSHSTVLKGVEWDIGEGENGSFSSHVLRHYTNVER